MNDPIELIVEHLWDVLDPEDYDLAPDTDPATVTAKEIWYLDDADAVELLEWADAGDESDRVEWINHSPNLGIKNLDLDVLKSLAVIGFSSFTCKKCKTVGYDVSPNNGAPHPAFNGRASLSDSTVDYRKIDICGKRFEPLLCKECLARIIREI